MQELDWSELDFDDWHDENCGPYKCYRCDRKISPSDYEDGGYCSTCLEDEEFDEEDW